MEKAVEADDQLVSVTVLLPLKYVTLEEKIFQIMGNEKSQKIHCFLICFIQPGPNERNGTTLH
jgi:hypothetical protein